MKRDIGKELLAGVEAIKRGQGKQTIVELPADVKTIRSKTRLSQSAFTGLLGVSVRTLREWEQGRRTPKGPASIAESCRSAPRCVAGVSHLCRGRVASKSGSVAGFTLHFFQ